MTAVYSAIVFVDLNERSYRVDLINETVKQAVYLPHGRGVAWRTVNNRDVCSNAILRASDQWHAENPDKRLATGVEMRANGLAADARRKYGIR